MIKAAANDISNIATDRINEVISQGDKEVERVLPKILREAIEDVYQTPFRLLVNFGKLPFNKKKERYYVKTLSIDINCIYKISNNKLHA